MNILVTGATGFIGANLVQRLLTEGYKVRVFLRNKEQKKLWNNKKIETFVGNFEDYQSIKEAMKEIDIVYHLAAIRDKWGTPKEEYFKVNVEYVKNLLEASKESEIKQFIYCSSISVTTEPFCHHLYGQTKKKAEKIVRQFQNKGLPITIVRPVITYGPGDNGMVYKLINMINKNRYLTVGNGQNRVHLCYIDDLINGFLLVLNNKKAFGQTYCFCGPRPITINDLVKIISNLLNKRVSAIHIPRFIAKIIAWWMELIYKILSLKGEPLINIKKIETMTVDRCFDYKKAKKDLGYKPIIDYQEGLEKTIAWFEKEQG